MTISGGRTKQLDIFYCVTGFTSDFLSFNSCGTYLVLSRSPSIITCFSVIPPEIIRHDAYIGERLENNICSQLEYVDIH